LINDKTTRDHIVEAADDLFYRQGFEHTSFSDIADIVRISRGNFYYHFKTKDEILDAVIDARQTDTRKMLEQWERDHKDPADRIRSFIHILLANRPDIMLFGCPVGTLSTELAKLSHASQAEASKLFTLFRNWLRKQFTLLGCKANADALAMHLLARSQGVAVLANAFHDKKFIDEEVRQMCDWLQSCMDDARSNGRHKYLGHERARIKGAEKSGRANRRPAKPGP
jgi:AcrR family transcriptional regulator